MSNERYWIEEEDVELDGTSQVFPDCDVKEICRAFGVLQRAVAAGNRDKKHPTRILLSEWWDKHMVQEYEELKKC